MDRALLEELSRITEEERRLLDGQALDKTVYTDGRGFVVDRQKMLDTGKLVSVRPHTRFIPFPAHSHNYIEIIYMCSGSTTHVINGEKPLTLKAGQLLFLNQHVSHSIEKAGEKDVAVNFIVLPAFFDTALEMIGPDNVLGRFLVSGLQQHGGDIQYLHFDVTDTMPVQHLVQSMIWGFLQKQPNNRQIISVSMGLLFLQLLNYTSRLDTAPTGFAANAIVVEALREIEENYQSASLSLVAKQHGVSLAYVSGLVRGATGATFKDLLREKRLAKALQLLKTTRLSVGEIITAVGYENTSYFYRIFREKYGRLPTEYRRGTAQ